MSDFDSLDSETRCYALVGKFLFKWAILESSMKDAIARTLDLDPIPSAIANANIQFRDKINILKTAIAISTELSPQEVKNAQAALNEINDLSGKRNIVAHNMFFPDENGGVQFFLIKAKGDMKIITEIWSFDDFYKYYEKIEYLTTFIEGITRTITAKKFTQAFITAPFAPTGAFGGLGIGGLLQLPQDREAQSSGASSSTQAEYPETAPSDRG